MQLCATSPANAPMPSLCNIPGSRPVSTTTCSIDVARMPENSCVVRSRFESANAYRRDASTLKSCTSASRTFFGHLVLGLLVDGKRNSRVRDNAQKARCCPTVESPEAILPNNRLQQLRHAHAAQYSRQHEKAFRFGNGSTGARLRPRNHGAAMLHGKHISSPIEHTVCKI